VMNNPLNAVDPTGFVSLNPFKRHKEFGRKTIRSAAKIFGEEVVNYAGSMVASYFGGAWGAALWSYEFARAMGATSSEARKGAVITLVTSAAYYYIGGNIQNPYVKVVAHGMVGGVTSVLQGGKFGHGFVSAGMTKLINVNGWYGTDQGIQHTIARTTIAAIIGGTISEATGGKFANGARTAAMAQLFIGERDAERENAQKARTAGKIHITGHRVGRSGPYHTALEYDDGTGVQWISAGPEGMSAEGFENLVGGVGNMVNGVRPSDAPSNNIVLGIVSPPQGMTPGEYFKVLTSAAGNYTKYVDYDMFPRISNSYNSNSYVAGIVNSTGGKTSIDMSVFVGGEKPLPRQHFGY
jgi:hypothetical protein